MGAALICCYDGLFVRGLHHAEFYIVKCWYDGVCLYGGCWHGGVFACWFVCMIEMLVWQGAGMMGCWHVGLLV